MEVGVAAMPATAVPTTKAAANYDVGAAVVVVVAARITVIASVIICGRADSDAYAKRPRVESHLRHCWRRRGRRQQSRRTNSKRKLSHLSPPVTNSLRKGNAKRRGHVPRNAPSARELA